MYYLHVLTFNRLFAFDLIDPAKVSFPEPVSRLAPSSLVPKVLPGLVLPSMSTDLLEDLWDLLGPQVNNAQ